MQSNLIKWTEQNTNLSLNAKFNKLMFYSVESDVQKTNIKPKNIVDQKISVDAN